MRKSGKLHQAARRAEVQYAADLAVANQETSTETDIDRLARDRGAVIFANDGSAHLILSRNEDAVKFRRLIKLYRPDKLLDESVSRVPGVADVELHMFTISAGYARGLLDQKRVVHDVNPQNLVAKASEMLGIVAPAAPAKPPEPPKQVTPPAPPIPVSVASTPKPTTLLQQPVQIASKKQVPLDVESKYSPAECLDLIAQHAVVAEVHQTRMHKTYTHVYVKGDELAKELYASLLHHNYIAGAPERTQAMMQYGELFEIRINQRISQKAFDSVPAHRAGTFEADRDLHEVREGAAGILKVKTGPKIMIGGAGQIPG